METLPSPSKNPARVSNKGSKGIPLILPHQGSKVSSTTINPKLKSSTSSKSKVREYIREVKRHDQEAKIMKQLERESLNLSLEDLYLGESSIPEIEMSPETAKRELRKTLRILKEKDMVIMKLRAACHDLNLKYADAENTIDEMRFHGSGASLRKSQSEYHLGPTQSRKETKDQGTETNVDVLSESCSSWMEKVRNWKTESMFQPSLDADSGFRGSDVVDPDILQRVKTKNSLAQAQCSGDTSSKELANQERALHSHLQSTRRSMSHTNLNSTATETHKSSGRTTSQLKELDHLLDLATIQARRVQKKSQRLSHLLQSADKRV